MKMSDKIDKRAVIEMLRFMKNTQNEREIEELITQYMETNNYSIVENYLKRTILID